VTGVQHDEHRIGSGDRRRRARVAAGAGHGGHQAASCLLRAAIPDLRIAVNDQFGTS
jgi:hypothetical protein